MRKNKIKAGEFLNIQNNPNLNIWVKKKYQIRRKFKYARACVHACKHVHERMHMFFFIYIYIMK